MGATSVSFPTKATIASTSKVTPTTPIVATPVPPPLPPHLPKAPVVPAIPVVPPPPVEMAEELKAAFLDMANSFKEIGQTAKQNNTNFLGDIPFYGIPPSQDKKKSIIPLSESNRFLNLVDTVTERAEFTVAGKISVLKSKLLGPALEHWNDYNGGDDWNAAKIHLL